MRFKDLLQGLTPCLEREFGKNILDFECKLLNIHDINLYDEKIKDLPTRPILFIMASIWRLELETVRELFRMGEALDKKDQQFLMQKALDYIVRTDPTFTIKKLQRTEEETVIREENRVMTALQSSLDQYRMEGREEGREEGLMEVALRMIQKGFDAKMIHSCTGLTSKEVENLRKKAKSQKS